MTGLEIVCKLTLFFAGRILMYYQWLKFLDTILKGGMSSGKSQKIPKI